MALATRILLLLGAISSLCAAPVFKDPAKLGALNYRFASSAAVIEWTNGNVVFEGDSLTFQNELNNGTGNPSPAHWLAYMRPALVPGATLTNMATGGQTTGQMTNDIATTFGKFIAGKTNVAIFKGGANDNNNGVAVGEACTNASNWVAWAFAASPVSADKVIICTVPYLTGLAGGLAWLTNFNNYVLGMDNGTTVFVCRLHTNPVFTANLHADNVHYKFPGVLAYATQIHEVMTNRLNFNPAKEPVDRHWLASALTNANGVTVTNWVDTNASLHAYNTTAANMPVFSDSGGIKSVDFDGTSDYLIVDDTALLDCTTVTLCAWVFQDGATTDSWIFSKYNADFSQGYGMINLDQGGSAKLFGGVGIGANNFNICTNAYIEGQWIHLAMTYDGLAITTYTNGLQAGRQINGGTAFAAIVDNAEPLNMARRRDNIQFFDGKMRDIRINRRPLTPAEVLAVKQEDAQ